MNPQQVKSLQEEIEKESAKIDDQLQYVAFNDGARFAISQFQRQEAEGWVKVEDGLPEVTGYYLFYNIGWEVGWFESDEFLRFENAKWVPIIVTHWRKLPSPPETK